MMSRRTYPPTNDTVPVRTKTGKIVLPPKQVQFHDVVCIKSFHEDDPIPNNPIVLAKPRSILKTGLTWDQKAANAGHQQPIREKKKGKATVFPGGEMQTLAAITRSQTHKIALAKYARKQQAEIKKNSHTTNTNNRVQTRTQHPPHKISEPIDTKPIKTTRTQIKHTNTQQHITIQHTDPKSQQINTKTNIKKQHKPKPYVSKARTKKKQHPPKTKIESAAHIALEALRKAHPSLPNSADLMKAQASDPFASMMIDYIQKDILPTESTLARRILLHQDQFAITEGILVRITPVEFGTTRNCYIQLVIPHKWSISIMQATHDSPLGGHLGVLRTYDTIRSRYFWPSFYQHIHDFVATCHTCMKSKFRNNQLTVPMTLREPILESYTDVSVDCLGPIHQAADGSKYIHVATCYATRHVTAWTSPDTSSASFALGMFNNICCKFGIPARLYSDNGSTFISKFFKDFCTTLGIKQIHGSVYRSASQGLVERANRSIEASLRAFTDKAQNNWHIFLQAIVFALNNTVSASLGFSPSLLIYGKQSTLPADIKLKLNPEIESEDMRDIVVALAARRNDVMASASNNLRKAHTNMKNRHDIKSKTHDFSLGDYVYLYVPSLLVPRTSKKMQSQFMGPYIIIKFQSKYTCMLMRCQDGKRTKRPVHVQRLRKPRVRDKAFLKRLPTGPDETLMNPDRAIATKLSPKDAALIGAGVGPRKNHSKAATKHNIKINMGAMFNNEHKNIAFKQVLEDA